MKMIANTSYSLGSCHLLKAVALLLKKGRCFSNLGAPGKATVMLHRACNRILESVNWKSYQSCLRAV